MEGRVNLPPKIMLDIISRLPVKPLCRCKCLSRAWRSRLSDPDFVAKYNKDAFFQGRRRLLCTVRDDRWRQNIYSLNLNQLVNENVGGSVAARPIPLYCVVDHLPDPAINWSPFIQYSSNALFLSQSYKYPSGYSECSLINPVTMNSDKLPETPIWRQPMKPFSLQLYGLGFDHCTNEYKVINGQQYDDGIVFSVYTLQTRSWRQIDYLFPYKALYFGGIVVNGAVHWLAKKIADGSLVIISFLLAKVEFSECPVPPVPRTFSMELGAFRDWLCITLSKRTKIAAKKKGTKTAAKKKRTEKATYNEFWIMKEYGVKESWTTMQVSKPYKTLSHSGFWTGSYDLMVFDESSLVMYNFSDDKFWTLDFGIVGTFCSVGTYVESLPLTHLSRTPERSKEDESIQ